MDSFVSLLEGEKVILELEHKGCCHQEKAYLTNKRIIEHEISKFLCIKREEVYCTYLSDILSLSYSDHPCGVVFCCCRKRNIIFKTLLSTRRLPSGHEDMTDIVTVFTKAIQDAHNEK